MQKKLFIESWSSTKRYTYNLFIKNQFTAKTRNQENNGLITVAKEWMIATFERITFLQPIYSNSIEQREFLIPIEWHIPFLLQFHHTKHYMSTVEFLTLHIKSKRKETVYTSFNSILIMWSKFELHTLLINRSDYCLDLSIPKIEKQTIAMKMKRGMEW